MRPIDPADLDGPAGDFYGALALVKIAEHQDEYLTLVARADRVEHELITAWELTAVERAAILAGAPIMLRLVIGPIYPFAIWVNGCETEAQE